MKVSLQTILNVCFAISLTALIYQNNQLNDSIDTLKGYAQLDTDKAWERMDTLENGITTNYANFIKQGEYNEELQKVIAELQVNMYIAFDNFDIAKKNEEITDARIKANSDTLDYIQSYLVENFGNK